MNILDFIGTRYVEFSTEFPSIGGIAQSEIGKPGTKAELVVGGQVFLLDVDPLTGRYDWAAVEAFMDGEYSVSLRIIDLAGNYSDPLLLTFLIDTTPPDAPDLIKLYDDVGPVQGGFESGDTTDDKRPTLTGIAQKGTTVYLLNERNERIGSAVADKVTGKWEMEPSQDLNEGSNSLRLVAEEFFAKELRSGPPSEPFIINVDTREPVSTPELEDVYDNFGPLMHSLNQGDTTDDCNPVFSGIAGDDVAFVRIYNFGVEIARVAVVNGKWSWEGSESAFKFGSHSIALRGEDSQGNLSEASSKFVFYIYDSHNSQAQIIDAFDDFGAKTGAIKHNGNTDDATPTLRGFASAGTLVYIQKKLADGQWENVGSAVVNSRERWEFTVPELANNGTWSFRAKPVDGYGEGQWGNTFKLKLTGVIERLDKPVINDVFDDFGSDTGSISNGGITDDRTPTLRGKGTMGSIVKILSSRSDNNGFNEIGSAVVGADGNWSWTAPALNDNGGWYFRAYAIKDGQQTEQSDSFSIVIDPTIDLSATIDYAYDNFGSVTGSLGSGSHTDDSTPTLHGSGTANSVIYLQSSRNGGAWSNTASAIADSNGKWQITAPKLSSGEWNFRVQVSNEQGSSDWSDSFELTLNIPVVITTPSIQGLYAGLGGASYYIYEGIVPAKNHQYTRFIGTASEGAKYVLVYRDYTLVAKVPVRGYEWDAQVSLKNGTNEFNFQTEYADGRLSSKTRWYGYQNKNSSFAIQEYSDENEHELSSVAEINKPDDNILTQISVIGGTNGKTPDINEIDNADISTPIDGLKTNSEAGNSVSLTADIIEGNSVELTNIKGKALNIDLSDILRLGDKNLFIEDDKTQLLVKGNDGDVVELKDILPEGSDISEWQHQDGTVTVAGVEYNVYTHGDDAELLVQQGVKTELV